MASQITAVLERGGAENMASFIKTFGEPDDVGYVIPLTDFDAWARAEYLEPGTYDASWLVSFRNRVKITLNAMATSEGWIAGGNEPFHISVAEHGVSYRVAKAANAFIAGTVTYPGKVERALKTKNDNMQRILDSVDQTKLSLETRMQAQLWLYKGTELSRYVSMALGHYMSDYENLVKTITDQTGGKTLLATPGGQTLLTDGSDLI